MQDLLCHIYGNLAISLAVWVPCRTCACAHMMDRNMTFDLLDNVIKVTFEQHTEKIVYLLLSPVKVPSILH